MAETDLAIAVAGTDVFANIPIIVAGLVTIVWRSVYPDLIIGVINADAAKGIWQAPMAE
ncbi:MULTISPECIES: hypothetical protein [Stakelama]|uniref:Uncharacterized protein n=3 Tax=Stakelama TaxID=1124625 RepID=A0A8T4IE86_9SPHN|nr:MULTISPECIES: hypothetical protein [Stakelama]MBR0552761.1 hypothetical protein [Stakelama marina]TDN85316.1 hypothetical protein EV664_10221 [Stakelama pacifica]WNO53495.1 hypothetical protein RPR59_13775 [Stakelama sp. W311]GGO92996.1 hypothetical protein GCM10011329_11410 [Stakelama pacifica]|tara:strand:+ start:603 stop:779 length:177 start_codon:yes stop_codon:yes gene_type:complete